MKEIQAPKDRTSDLESKITSGPTSVHGNASKRPRSHPPSSPQSHTSTKSACAVITGFPKCYRKKDIEAFVNTKLQLQEDWKQYKAFAPNVRGTVGMIKMTTTQEVSKFINQWNDQHYC